MYSVRPRLLRSESPSGKCAKLHTVAANNNRDHMSWSLYYCLFTPHIYGCYSSRTSRSWWIVHSTQRQRGGCNNVFQIIFMMSTAEHICFVCHISSRIDDFRFQQEPHGISILLQKRFAEKECIDSWLSVEWYDWLHHCLRRTVYSK